MSRRVWIHIAAQYPKASEPERTLEAVDIHSVQIRVHKPGSTSAGSPPFTKSIGIGGKGVSAAEVKLRT